MLYPTELRAREGRNYRFSAQRILGMKPEPDQS